MLFPIKKSICALLALVSYVAAYPDPRTVTGDIDGVDDPSMCKVGSTYYLYGTGIGIPIWTSPNRTAFTSAGSIFPDGAPSKTDTYTGTSGTASSLWAPDCTYYESTFYVYYAASRSGAENSGIFLVSSTNGLTNWTDHGLVTSSTTSSGYNAIDPHLIIVSGSWYLSLGSFWSGIKLFSISASTGKPSSTSYTNISERTTAGGAEEASWIYKTGGNYYLFTSFDKCCDGTASTYNIRVSRSTSLTGPYVDESGVEALSGGGTEILGTHDYVYGPGGQSLLVDGDEVVLVYHYYSATASTFKLGINLLDFSTGWPVVN